MSGRRFTRTTYAFDRNARREAIAASLAAAGKEELPAGPEIPLLMFRRTTS